MHLNAHLFGLLVASAMCGCEAAQTPDYQGEVLARLHGRVEDRSRKARDGIEIVLSWLSEHQWVTARGSLDGVVDWEVPLFTPPPPAAREGWGAVSLGYAGLPEGDAAAQIRDAFRGLAFGWLILMRAGYWEDAPSSTVDWDDEQAIQEGAAQVVGGVEGAFVLFAEREFSADSWPGRLLGQAVTPGYHLLLVTDVDFESYEPCEAIDEAQWEERLSCSFGVRAQQVTLRPVDELLTLTIVDEFEDLSLPILL